MVNETKSAVGACCDSCGQVIERTINGWTVCGCGEFPDEPQQAAAQGSLELMCRMRDDAALNGDHAGAAEMDAAIHDMEVR